LEAIVYEETARFQDRHWYFVAMREILWELLNPRGRGPDLRILDVGCGTRQYSRMLSSLGRVVGVDIAPGAVCRVTKSSNSHEAFVQADAEKLPFPDGSFDLVWAVSVLEHLERDGAGIREIIRVTRPGGQIAIAVPSHRFLWGHMDELAHHLRRYTRRELVGLCEDNGLAIRRMTHYGAAPFPWAFVIRKLKNALGLASPEVKNITDFRLATFPGLGGLFLNMLRLEKAWLKRRNLPFGLMLFALTEKRREGKGG